MREELKGPKVENIAVAVVKEKHKETGEDIHNVYLLNFKEDIIEGVIITSVGYGHNPNTGEKVKTSTLRHTIEVLFPNEAAKIEPIMPDVFGLSNEYWVSFYIDGKMYDKKFVFLPETIQEENMREIPKLGAKGVLIQ